MSYNKIFFNMFSRKLLKWLHDVDDQISIKNPELIKMSRDTASFLLSIDNRKLADFIYLLFLSSS